MLESEGNEFTFRELRRFGARLSRSPSSEWHSSCAATAPYPAQQHVFELAQTTRAASRHSPVRLSSPISCFSLSRTPTDPQDQRPHAPALAPQPLLPRFLTTRTICTLRAGGQEFDIVDGESGSASETRMVERERGRGTRELVLASMLAAAAMPFASPFARLGYQFLRLARTSRQRSFAWYPR